ncbi:MAG: class I SAM-dependent methyltransferase [Nanoarchaeota archaeon]
MISKEEFDDAYSKTNAPWTSTSPPGLLKGLIAGGIIKPCKALDVGCGEGYNSIFLAKHGFDVTGIDFSRKAINYSKENSTRSGTKVNFKVMDALNIGQMNETFDFVLEWLLINHLEKKFFDNHVSRINRLMNHKGLYLSSSLSDNAENKNINCYTMEELSEVFSKYFEIITQEQQTTTYDNKLRLINVFLLKKKE